MPQAKDGFNTWMVPSEAIKIPSAEVFVSELADAIEKREL
jgi:hypothetical protein